MNCPCCHRRLADNAKRCPHCGTSLLNTCAVCGVEYPLGVDYCPKCGASKWATQYYPNAKAEKKKKKTQNSRFILLVIAGLIGVGLLSSAAINRSKKKTETVSTAVTPAPTVVPTFDPDAEEDTQFYLTPELSWGDISTPTEIECGSGFSVAGAVFTDVGLLTDVTVSITNSFGNIIQSYSYDPGETMCDLKEFFDSEIHFGTLPVGAYTYEITATAANGTQSCTAVICSAEFAVTGDETAESRDSLAGTTWDFLYMTWRDQNGHINENSVLGSSASLKRTVSIDATMFLSGGCGNAQVRGYVSRSGGGYTANLTNADEDADPVEEFDIISTFTDPSDGSVYKNVMHFTWEEFDLYFILEN